MIIDINELNQKLASYDEDCFQQLEPILVEMRSKSKALAANLERCFYKFRDSDRYLNAYYGEAIAIKEKDLREEEFLIFREYVRLLRSCTIMCGPELSQAFKKLFMDFFAGTRVKLAQELALTNQQKPC